MTEPIPPLVVDFEVAAPVGHAFATWTERAALWWPRGHTVSGDPDAVVFEPRPGGRVVERGADGSEHVWGEVIDWEPPHRLRFWWHLFFDRVEATVVELTFTAVAERRTAVRLVQTGWDALGGEGPTRRERTVHGWAAVTAPYRDLLDRPTDDPRAT